MADETQSTLIGIALDEKSPIPLHSPGLTPVAKELHAIMDKVAELESSAFELDQVRATLLLNFGATRHNRYGFVVDESQSTMAILMAALQHLPRRRRFGEEAPEEPKKEPEPCPKNS